MPSRMTLFNFNMSCTLELENKLDKPSDAAAVLPVVPAPSLQQVSVVFTLADAQAICRTTVLLPCFANA